MPGDDPTLLFTNAGMNQFKDVFLGREKRDYTRAATSQKCMRVSGKHNDLDNVGPSLRHHTFFEMLGNFSFGDYFKQDAIELAWELLTEEWKLPAGPAVSPPSSRARTASRATTRRYELWRELVPADRIGELGMADNFWAMGDTGPVRPLLGDLLRPRRRACPAPATSCRTSSRGSERFVEIWNNVFMEFERQRRRHADAAAGAVDRHRHGPRAHHRGACRASFELRHRPVHAAARRDRRAAPGTTLRRHDRARPTSRCASSPTTRAR